MPIEIRELVIRSGVEPEPPNVPDSTPIELPELIIRADVAPRPVELPELVIRAHIGERSRPPSRSNVIVLPEMVIRTNVSPASRTRPIELSELVIRAHMPVSHTFAQRVPITMARPSFEAMKACYADYVEMPKPCTNPRAENQCAIRMSTALARCGFPIHRFPDRRRVHRPKHCRIQVPHVLGAQELEEFLRSRMTGAVEYRKLSGVDAFNELQDRRGIVFFDRVDGRTDHIDLFDGAKIQNEVLYGPVRANTTSYFEQAKRITFFPLG